MTNYNENVIMFLEIIERKLYMERLKVEYLNIDELKPYKNNAKIHTAEQIEQIKKSIQDFGFNDPIAIDENNVIIERTWKI